MGTPQLTLITSDDESAGSSIKLNNHDRGVNQQLLFAACTYSDEDLLALDVNVGDGKLVGQRHDCDGL